MITTLTIDKKPRKDGSIAISYTAERGQGWESGGTYGHLHYVDGYYVLMRYNTIPQGVFTGIDDFINRFEMATGVTPLVVE